MTRASAVLLALVTVLAACPESKVRPRGSSSTSEPARTKAPRAKRHPGHEHGHGAHPHGRSPHHHHPHPHPHLDGGEHHHPY